MPTLAPLTLPISLLPTSGGASSVEVPGLFDCAIAGRGYMIDWDRGERAYRHDSTNLLRDQADTGSVIGEQSINPEGPWRRTADSWHGGAGQRNRDQADSVPSRFNTSHGVDVWTESQVTLLPESVQSLSSASTNLPLVVAGSRVYVGDGNTTRYSADPFAGSPTWTAVTGTPASAVTDITSDGYQVYIAYGANGVYETDTSTSAASGWLSGQVDAIDWVRGRMMIASGASIHEETTKTVGSPSAALGSALFTHRNAQFRFVGFAESLSHIYAAGYAGDKSEIYSITIEADGTALAAPTVAGVLPDGEVVSAIYGYLGFILIGTSRGVRFAVAESTGNLTIGALIETGVPVRDFEGQGRFVWFTWDEHSDSVTGLARLDLSTIESDGKLQPAYATDLHVTSTADVMGVVTLDDKRVYTLSGAGVYVEGTDKVASGTLYSGEITYGLSEQKTTRDHLVTVDLADGGTVEVALEADSSDTYTSLGTISSSGTTRVLTNEIIGNRFESRLTLNRSATDQTKGPTLYSSTLRAYPRVQSTKYITASLLIRERVEAHNGTEVIYDLETERAVLDALWSTQQITSFQEGNESWSVVISNISYVAETPNRPENPHGVLELQMKVIS